MRETRLMMGMPVTVEIADQNATAEDIERVFSYFQYIDDKFSVYKSNSEITKINKGLLRESNWSDDMKTVFDLSEKTKKETGGYFDIKKADGKYDPSGIVKGLAIYKAAELIRKGGHRNYYVEAGGDIQVSGKNKEGKIWKVGIADPFHKGKIIKIIYLDNLGIATSGTYERGHHIYNPKNQYSPITEIVGLSVIGPNVYEADRFATAAFAMGKEGINFIERLKDFEGYIIDQNGVATMTSGFEKYLNA